MFKTYRLKDIKIAITAEASSREFVPQNNVSQEAWEPSGNSFLAVKYEGNKVDLTLCTWLGVCYIWMSALMKLRNVARPDIFNGSNDRLVGYRMWGKWFKHRKLFVTKKAT